MLCSCILCSGSDTSRTSREVRLLFSLLLNVSCCFRLCSYFLFTVAAGSIHYSFVFTCVHLSRTSREVRLLFSLLFNVSCCFRLCSYFFFPVAAGSNHYSFVFPCVALHFSCMLLSFSFPPLVPMPLVGRRMIPFCTSTVCNTKSTTIHFD